MTKIYRIGVLGLTHDHVWQNLEEIYRCPNALVVAAADPNKPLLEKVQKLYECATYREHENLLDRERLDAVYVFGDNANSSEIAEQAASRGLHVLVEKPMAATLDGADALLASARMAGVHLMVNWPFAWWPQLQHALSIAQSGELGDIWQVKYRAAHNGPKELGCSEYFCSWLYNRELNGAGALIDYGCYGAALACHLLGLPSRVTAMAGRLVKEDILVDDNAVILMRYPRGLATSEASWTEVGSLTQYVTVIAGTRGTLLVGPGKQGQLLWATEEHPQGQPVEVPELPPHRRGASSHFLHVLETGEPFVPPCDPRTSRDAQEVLEAAVLAVESGTEVSLPLRSV